ncbi:UNVERIFIED_CONTAM: hypothetical protein HDU68_010357 [Siphonaria sp. JEL0065]|nr:hypothetical protein HDU68_010357 [Siphonaria sp. JEL0065]
MHKSRKPVTYDITPTDLPLQLQHSYEAPSADAIGSLPSYTRFRSLTDLSFTSKQSFSAKQLPDHPLYIDAIQTPQEQLERVRRLTVDDAEMVLQAHQQLAETAVEGEEYQRRRKGSRRGTGRFGHFSFKFKPRKHFTENPLDILKSTASKIYNKLNFMKPKTDEFTTIAPLMISEPILTRSHSVAGSFVMPPRRLVRQPSISSFNSIATAPECMYSTSSSASSIIGTRDIPRKPAPQRPASMIAPAAEHVYARDVLGPMPRNAKVLGPRMSECQTLRVSGHVRQTYTRTLQRGNMENRRSLPSKPLPEAPAIGDGKAPLPTTSDEVEAAPESSPLIANKEQQISDVVSLVQEPFQVSESQTHQSLSEAQVDDNTANDTINQKHENEMDVCGLGDVSGADEFFDAAEEENQSSETLVTAPSEQQLSQETGHKSVPTSTEQEIQFVLDTLTDKINSLGPTFDHDALEKINAAKHVMEEILTHSNKQTIQSIQKQDNSLPPPSSSSLANDQWSNNLIEGSESELASALLKMEAFLKDSKNSANATVTVLSQKSKKAFENFNDDEVGSSEQELISNDSEVLFGLLNNALTLDAKVNVIKTLHKVELDKGGEGEEKKAGLTPVTAITGEGKVDMKKKFQELRAKFNSQHNGINSGKEASGGSKATSTSRWFKKAPPPPPSISHSVSASSALGDLANVVQQVMELNSKGQTVLGVDHL